ncbi:hypothetical protein FNYG_14707 [Fusarium nygamai]|uniref:Carboxylic ester hydrolase n=1 Tax=Gibberella nygamai TaxID=42673 RepID=A0A2K0UQD3_GIBNY|nr:hypothetical protein FNYG_14707 [Fusarium nygamai]
MFHVARNSPASDFIKPLRAVEPLPNDTLHPATCTVMRLPTSLVAFSMALFVSALDITSRCDDPNIHLADIPGTKLFGKTAELVENVNFTSWSAQSMVISNITLNVCNVTINYGHIGWHDNITVTIWLPLRDWNHRLSGVGGAGMASLAGYGTLGSAVDRGYAAVGTDAGHEMDPLNADSWARDESGRVNFFLLQNFFAISQHEAAIIAKRVIHDVYQKDPEYSYWNGCSTGGRQGLMLAQRYPGTYDGILAGAPAINWATFVPVMYYPQFVMNQLNHYPKMCVLSAIVDAAVEACDELDGVKDGILSLPNECHFDPSQMVGKQVKCEDDKVTVSEKDAQLVRMVWDGPKHKDGTPIWYGMNRGASFIDLANSACNGDRCQGVPFGIASTWIQNFVLQNSTADLTALPEDGFGAVTNLSISAYKSVTSTDNPDLRDFRESGGKLLHWHGMQDQEIFIQGSENYYQRAEARDKHIRDFYRYFEAPGVGHCGGDGLVPNDPLAALVDWVERGVAPDHLAATTGDGKQKRNLCPYPLVPSYLGGDFTKASSYECKKHYKKLWKE